jgi:hypothetical protein
MGMLLHFLRRSAHSRRVLYLETKAPTLQQALFWINLYRELLAVDENALQRMRTLLLEDSARERGVAYYDPDVELVIGEVERVRARHDHWLALVERMS